MTPTVRLTEMLTEASVRVPTTGWEKKSWSVVVINELYTFDLIEIRGKKKFTLNFKVRKKICTLLVAKEPWIVT